MNGAEPTSGPRRRANVGRILGAAAAAVAVLVSAAIPAAAAELMTVTFVRHGESAGNASGLIDTSTPGPHITALGQQQAQAVVGKLGVNNYDSIYASTMIRTQETAAPMSQYLHLPVQVLPGIQEIEAGVFEGTPESQASQGYAKVPLAWVFQGNLNARIPQSIDGNEFEARMNSALQTIYNNGDRNAIVFSHGGAIMFWTLMNANNLTLPQKITLLQTAALKNTDYVVVQGNPQDGWTLVNWNGQQFATGPTLEAQVQLQVRTLTRQLSATAQQVAAAFATRDVTKIVNAVGQGASETAYSLTKFGNAVRPKLVTALNDAVAELTTKVNGALHPKPASQPAAAASTPAKAAAAAKAGSNSAGSGKAPAKSSSASKAGSARNRSAA